jgi:protein-L-isoaspartate(D-aspartate) O-methyltransferase
VASEVYSIERLRGLHDKARDNLRHLRLPNVHLLFGDGMVGYAKGAPYAGIIAAAGGEAVPDIVDRSACRRRTHRRAGRAARRPAGAGGVEKAAGQLKHTVLESVHFVPLKSGVA